MFKRRIYLALFVLINLGFLLPAYEGKLRVKSAFPKLVRRNATIHREMRSLVLAQGRMGRFKQGLRHLNHDLQ